MGRMGRSEKSKKSGILFLNSIHHFQVYLMGGLRDDEILCSISVTWCSHSHHGNLVHHSHLDRKIPSALTEYQFTWYKTPSPSH